jgi:hypothetical protein
MPYEMENPLAVAVGTASSFLNAREDNKRQADAAARKQADDDREFKRQQSLTDAQIQNYQSLGSEREAKVQQISAVLPYLPLEMRARIATLIGKGDLEGAQAALTNAKIPETQAQTGLIKAKTTTEVQRPALIKAQTKNVNNLPESRAQALQERYWQAKTASDTALAKGQMQLAAAQARQAASIAAAFDRLQTHDNFEEQQQSRGFKHSDELVDRRAKTKPPKAASEVERIKPKIASLPAKAQSIILKMAKEGVSVEGIRDYLDSAKGVNPDLKAAIHKALADDSAPSAPAVPLPNSSLPWAALNPGVR